MVTRLRPHAAGCSIQKWSRSALAGSFMSDTKASEPLALHSSFRSDNLDEFRSHLSASYCDHKVFGRTSSDLISACHTSASLGAITLNYLRYGAQVEVRPETYDTFYMLEVPCSGEMLLTCNGQAIRNRVGMATLISPSCPVRSVWSAECSQLMIKISRSGIEQTLASILGRSPKSPVIFKPDIDLTSSNGAAIARLVQFLYGQFEERSSFVTERQLRGELSNLLISALLYGHPHNYSDDVQNAKSGITPRHVKRAIDYIDSHLHEEIHVSDLVDVSGASIRSLFAGFKQFTSMTPLEYVRNRRLHKVREDLKCARPGERVADIATRWGFTHLGRFSASYQELFGERPSDALRR